MRKVEGIYYEDTGDFVEFQDHHKGQGWKSSTDRIYESSERLQKFRERRLTFGVDILDQAIGGIISDDLVLVGAPSGVGKTGFITGIAKSNVEKGKRVHLIALEAYEGEIEDRIKYNMYAKLFYADQERKRGHISYRGWVDGKHDEAFEKYELDVLDQAKGYSNLHTFYKTKDFTINDFEREAFNIHRDTDLIILDHVHYFDIEDDNENRAFKKIVKKIRDVIHQTGIPVVLVAHLRKKDKNNTDVASGIDEFHGSSDLTKISTKVITIGRGALVDKHTSATYFRIPKNRYDGSVAFYCLKLIFDFRSNDYDKKKSQLGLINKKGNFEMLDKSAFPDWYRA